MSKKNFKITGTTVWAKIFGEPHPNYNEDGNEWSIDVEPDAESTNLLERLGVGHKIIRKGSVSKNGSVRTRNDYITFSRPEIKRSGPKKGDPNDLIPVVDSIGRPWPENTSIGNGSTVEVEFGIFEIPPKGKFKGGPKQVIYKITVLNLVQYKRPEHSDGAQHETTEKTDKPVANGKTETWTEGQTNAQE